MVRKLRHLIASKIKVWLRVMSGMKSEGRVGWGNLGNKKADPDAEAEEIYLAATTEDMGRVRVGRWQMSNEARQGVQWDKVYITSLKKNLPVLVHWVVLKKLKNKQIEML